METEVNVLAADKRSKYRKIKIINIVLTVVIVAAAFVYINIYSVSDDLQVGLDGAKMYFGETKVRAKKDLGAPSEEREEDGYTVYKYTTVMMFETLTDSELKFKDGRLKEVEAVLSKVSDPDLFEKVISKVSEVYKDREDFFMTDKATYDASGYCKISGKAQGAGIYCEIFDKADCVMIVTRAGN